MRLEELKAKYAKMNESEKVGEGQKAFNRLANEMIRFGYRRQEAVSFGCLLVRLAAGSDKYASEEEYNLFKDSTGVELTLEEFKNMVRGAGKDDFIKVIDEIVEDDLIPEPEPVVEEPVKKRGRGRKAKIEPVIEDSESTNDVDDKVVPILSVLSSKEDTDVVKEINDDVDVSDDNDIEIIEDIVQETENNVEPDTSTDEVIAQDEESDDDNEPDLEKLLSAMKPLQEDILSDAMQSDMSEKETDDEDNIDATLEQLATEFVQTQDKIASESKSSGRGRIGKLRNILPFKQSKHKDQGLGDLFGWAGVAANDEDFSVPGFFTNASSKK